MRTINLTPQAPASDPSRADEEPRVVLRSRRRAGDRGIDLAVGATAAFGMLVVQTWFRAGTVIAAGDNGPPFVGLDGVTQSWSHVLAGTGSTSYASASLLEGALHDLVTGIGLSDALAQRLWYTLVFASLGAAVAWAAASFTRSVPAVVVAGATAVLSPFHIVTLPNLLTAVAVVALALVVGMGVRLWRGARLHPTFGVLLGLVLSPLARNPPLLALLVASIAVTSLALALRPDARRRGLAVGAWLAASSLFWVVPLAIHYALGMPGLEVVAQTDVDSWSWTQRHSGPLQVLRLVGFWAWGDPDTMGSSARLAGLPWSVFSLALPLAVVAAIPLARQRRVALGMGIVLVLFVVLATGINAPFGPVSRLLYEHVPGYWLFRQPMAKFGVVLVLGYSLLLALGVEGLVSRWPGWEPGLRRAAIPVGVVLLACVVAFAHPLWTGSVIPGARGGQSDLPSARVAVPQSWVQAGEWLDGAPVPGSVIMLPLADYYQQGTSWGYYGVDDLTARVTRRTTLNLLPGGYYEPAGAATALMRALEESLISGDGPGVTRLMQALGIGYVAVRTDLVRRPGRPLANASEMLLAAKANSSLRLAREFEHVSFFTAAEPSAPFAIPTATVDLAPGTSPDVVADVVASTPPWVAVVSDDLRSETTQAWRSSGQTTTHTVAVSEGPHLVSARAHGPLVWQASEGTDGSSRGAWVEVASVVSVDGSPIGAPPKLFLPAPAGAVGIEVDGVPLLFEQGIVPFEAKPGTEVRPLVEASALALVDPAQGTLGNCNNADGESLSAAGIQAKQIVDGVAIWTAKGSACLAIPVPPPPGATPATSWHVRVPFTRWTGQATRVCLWLPRETKCADGTPPASAEQEGVFDFVAALRPGEDPTGAQLMLYADKERGIDEGKTLTAFRGVTIAPVVGSEAVGTIPQVDNPREYRDLSAGEITLSVSEATAANLLLAKPIAANDCHRYDDAPPESVGLEFKLSGEGEEMAYGLAALRHSACVTLAIDVPPGLRHLTVEFDHRSDPVPGRWCLIAQELACIDSGPLPASSDWQHFRREVALPADGPAGQRSAGHYRLVLYADGASPEEPAPARPHEAHYRRASVRATFPVTAVVQPARPAGDDGPAVVVRRDAFAPQWSLAGVAEGVPARHVTVDGWANGWEVPTGVMAGLGAQGRFWPDRIASTAVWSLALVLAAAIAMRLLGLRRRRRAENPRVSSPPRRWLSKDSRS